MNYERANEIISSQNKVDVTYNDSLVAIDAIHENNDTVKVHFIDIPESYIEVPVNTLIEQ